ncbi:MAG: tetratricopeptide repeat protein [Bacteroidetes bacterium]|nr:tetratricopeptide repeat protein [Bacteroidota bacterium]
MRITILNLCLFILLSFSFTTYAQEKDAVDILVNSSSIDTVMSSQLLKLSKSLFAKGNYNLAIKAATSALSIYKSKNNLNGQYNAYERLASIAVKTNDSARAHNYFSHMREIGNATHNEKYTNAANFFLAKMHYQFGNFAYADSLSQIVVSKGILLHDSSLVAKTYIQIANIHLKKGEYKPAGENYFKALKIAESLSDSTAMSVCYTNLGTINRFLNNCDVAVVYHKKGLQLSIMSSNYQGIADGYTTLGGSYSCANKHDSSIVSYKNSVPYYLQLQSFEKLTTSYSNLAAVYQIIQQLDSCLHYHRLAKETAASTVDSSMLGNIVWNYGDALFAKYNATGSTIFLDEAFQNFKTSEYIANKFNLHSLKIYAYKSLAKVHEIKKNPQQELYYLKLYNSANDSVLASNYTNQIAEMQTMYETEKKETEIQKLSTEKLLDAEKIARQKTLNYSLLTVAALRLIAGILIFRNVQKKRIAEKQIAVLEKQNAIETMRSKIASDVHDDMGANLTKLGLNAQQLISKSLSGEQKQLAEKISLQSKEVITGMREIIWASNPANDNLKSMLGFMRQYIDRFFDGTNIQPGSKFSE